MSTEQTPSGTWRYRFMYEGQPYTEGGFRTEKQAKDAETIARDQAIQHKLHPDEVWKDLSFVACFKEYLQSLGPTGGGGAHYKLPRIEKFFGKLTLGEVGKEHIRNFLAMEAKDFGVSLATLDRDRRMIAAMYAWLHREKDECEPMLVNPAAIVRVPGFSALDNVRTRFLEPAEEKILMPAAMNHPGLGPYFYSALNTAMRENELCTWTPRHTNLEQRWIFIPPRFSKNGKGQYIPIAECFVPFVQERLAGRELDEPMLGRYHRLTVSRWFRLLVRDLQAQHPGQFQDLVFHDTRHWAGQYLLMKGISMSIVSQILRHSSEAVTRTHYGHLNIRFLKGQMDQIEGLAPKWGPELKVV